MSTPPNGPAGTTGIPVHLPVPSWLARQLERDATAGLFAAWGRSTVVDENVGAAVVGRDAVAALAEISGQADGYPEGNAGLLHVYGYLFSDVLTPYGLKSDRWLDGMLAEALGLDSDAFHPRAGAAGGPTMLSRVTAAARPLFDASPVDGAPGGGGFTLARRDAISPGLAALTVLRRVPGAAATALAYALETPDGIRLITLFPIAADPGGVLAALDAEAPRLRYNALGSAPPIRAGSLDLPDHAAGDRAPGTQ
ncbi:hypothetical protein [Microterricola viridarii]|uniref:Amino acid deaminase n=1 Tax=Microterricola viridarii TaxID=412690 RepID=A0A120I0R8_9MICO|nr:hypothetical protein [Microterricola viridarii]AMB59690.1 hypothetical protein AWU67_13385 [Microterricola viridarii]